MGVYGFRGSSPRDLDSLKKVILGVSRMMVEVGEIAELDLNPVILYPRGRVL